MKDLMLFLLMFNGPIYRAAEVTVKLTTEHFDWWSASEIKKQNDGSVSNIL